MNPLMQSISMTLHVYTEEWTISGPWINLTFWTMICWNHVLEKYNVNVKLDNPLETESVAETRTRTEKPLLDTWYHVGCFQAGTPDFSKISDWLKGFCAIAIISASVGETSWAKFSRNNCGFK